jgi:hypothetical protein
MRQTAMGDFYICTGVLPGPVQMWRHLYRVVTPTVTNVIASYLYRSEPPPGTNVWHLYQVGGRWRRRDPVRGHLYRLMPPTGTNVVIWSGTKNTQYTSKNMSGIYVRFSSSLTNVDPHIHARALTYTNTCVTNPTLTSTFERPGR